jgi:hypothetical protein
MSKTKSNLKAFFTIIVALFVIILGLFGTQWQIGHAETAPTVPTIPIIYSITPETICVGSGYTVATIRGDKFIDTTYTQVKWLDANYNYSYIIPDYVSVDGTELKFTIEPSKLSQVWSASLWVVNHPEINDNEIIGPFYIDIIGCEFIYLPLIMK